MTQNEQILNYLKQGNTITPLEAFNMFGCFRLGARAYDLKSMGHDITSRMITLENGKRVAQYRLENIQEKS